MPGNSLQDVVASALNSSDAIDIIEPIKAAVIREIEGLDPTVTIKSTDYFNHSFAPDFVLQWGDKQDREVYLRYSLKSTQAARDIEHLGKSGPVFFSLDSSHDDEETAEQFQADIRQAPSSLVTNVPAIDSFEADVEGSGAASPESVSTPLLALFRRNVVRGGRGLLISDTASRIRYSPAAHDLESDIRYIDSFQDTVSEIFQEDAAFRLHRAAHLVRIARSGETDLFDNAGEDEQPDRLRQGRLSSDELRVLLPYLLTRARTVDDVRFWRYLGSLMTLSQLEQVSDQITNLDLAALVKANLNDWRASRSMLTLNADAIDVEEESAATWTIHSKMLCAMAGVWKVHFRTDKRRSGSRDDSPLAQWDTVYPALRALHVSAIDLQGVVRRIQVSSDDESNVLTDAGSIQTTFEDEEFKVRSLTVKPSTEDASDITVDFKQATAEGSNIPLGDLARISFDIIGHRYPISPEHRLEIFGTEAQ